jgi:hypothetical protein
MCIRFVRWYIRTGRSCSPLLGRHAAVLVWPRTVRHRRPDGPGRSSVGPTASRVVDLPSRDGGSPRAASDCSAEQAGRSAYGSDGPGRSSDGPTVFRGADLPSRDDSGGICPGYEFISIPYNGWGWKSPFVADVLDIDIMLLVSYDRNLGATNFSNVRVNFLIDSSNPPICCFI